MALRTGWSLLNPLRTGPTQSVKAVSLFCQQQVPNRSFSAGSDDSANKPPEETWLSKFFSFDVTRTSQSAVVGSQNILYKLVFVRAYPEHQEELIKLGSKHLSKFAEPRDDCRLVGAWRTLIGRNEDLVHLWQYKEGYSTLDSLDGDLQPQDKDWMEYRHKCLPLIRSTESQIMMQLGYFDEPQERNDFHIYDLRSYKLKPGAMSEWAHHWSKGIQYRKSDNQNVAGFFTHIGELNMVHHLWAYKSFEARNKVRKNSWAVGDSGWSKTVANTVPLIKNIKSRIMTALPYSWLK